MVLPSFDGDKRLCVKFVLMNYIKRNKYRTGVAIQIVHFIYESKPYNPVSSVTLARWIRVVLSRAGIAGYGALSTRSASTSAVLSAGLPLTVIMKAAD